jgi:hypothetical protein
MCPGQLSLDHTAVLSLAFGDISILLSIMVILICKIQTFLNVDMKWKNSTADLM